MRLAILAALATPAVAATIESVAREGNRVLCKLDDGMAVLEWRSDSSFRFTRQWGEQARLAPATEVAAVQFQVGETPSEVKLTARHLVAHLTKNGVLVRTEEVDGTELMTDVTEAVQEGGVVRWERAAPLAASYYGLGARADGPVNVRGRRVEALKPFLISSAGYGEYHVAPGRYTFDLASARTNRYGIEARGADRVDYYFFYGPAPKEILEQYVPVEGRIVRLAPAKFGVLRPNEAPKEMAPPPKVAKGTWETLAAYVRWLVNGSLSGAVLSGFDLSPYLDAEPALRRRALQLAAVMPIVLGPSADRLRGTVREKLAAYWLAYAEEARDRGFPLIHPVPMQYPSDQQGHKYDDQFLFGDELLVAPILRPGNKRTLYLPMGIWINLRTNQAFQGRQVIEIEAADDELPLLSRNGALFPWGQDPTELHYFPKLGGEFFIFEPDLLDYSQMHAAPAGDVMRLQIESKKPREYEWIVHHIPPPARVVVREQAYRAVNDRGRLEHGAWFHDHARNNLHVRVRAAAGESYVANIYFP